jgi:hypothetical protein
MLTTPNDRVHEGTWRVVPVATRAASAYHREDRVVIVTVRMSVVLSLIAVAITWHTFDLKAHAASTVATAALAALLTLNAIGERLTHKKTCGGVAPNDSSTPTTVKSAVTRGCAGANELRHPRAGERGRGARTALRNALRFARIANTLLTEPMRPGTDRRSHSPRRRNRGQR